MGSAGNGDRAPLLQRADIFNPNGGKCKRLFIPAPDHDPAPDPSVQTRIMSMIRSRSRRLFRAVLCFNGRPL
jgi:hypothetical protein